MGRLNDRMTLAAGTALAVAVGLALAVSPGAAHADEAACAALKAPHLFPHTTVSAAAFDPDGICVVTAEISPVPASHIGVVYRLPAQWNGKLLGLGGGGWAGNVRPEAAAEGLSKGYATLQTDGGHPSASPWDTSWTHSPPNAPNAQVVDFSYRAVHEMTAVGRRVVARYYGRTPAKRYFEGCSTGGRMALMEAQRFPDDYDAIIAASPVYTLQVQTSALLRNRIFAAPGAAVDAAKLAMINAAVLQACDAQDGLKDGIVTDPRACRWDPAALLCTAGESGDACLTAPEVAAVRREYAGVTAANGEAADYPLTRGGELGWARFIQTAPAAGNDASGGGLGDLRTIMFGDPNFDLAKFKADRDMARVRGSEFAKIYEAKNPNLTAFTRHGGKLLIWHGFYDPGPSPFGTLAYYQAVRRVTGPAARQDVRFFLAPGVYHCGGGPGPSKMDLIGVLDAWSSGGTAPESIVAVKAPGPMDGPAEARSISSGPPLSRPICAYPALPHYKGSGDPNAAASFECR